ncbi:uncharacterized protein NEPG_01279 [Nematocida parisii ERTm1]|uniref:Uncharacterized protein n=1 Tax=Nematocida parisii (strain ERTm3) TaxID=935791 RepID=I3EG80_NEMP3|nr:uncharacterized protein NEPG_01279 [Nematocida parisii ERTm1]EIJ88227.1 hypothetical protein NEQG_01671 [Nematocida parisii ERTm3]EIJ93707.1 hypothetical protein NEPG_01279 [Nematocida parisii ERTm1]KAI5140587.1 hypothetical protein NEPAR04_0328 [Nematocida parisii]|eukprot:XP_013059107.1 hypothetical protein NEPG_01279 [Nematocida parisii ERTm1]
MGFIQSTQYNISGLKAYSCSVNKALNLFMHRMHKRNFRAFSSKSCLCGICMLKYIKSTMYLFNVIEVF